MALINCSECGKEISDRAAACPNCGCPVNSNKEIFGASQESINNDISKPQQEMINDEIIISEIIIDEERVLGVKKLLNIIYVALGIVIYIIMYLIDPYLFMYGNEGTVAIFIFYFIPCGILVLLLNKIIKKNLSNTLILTNKRIKGCVNYLLSTVEIDFPLNKINSIFVTHLVFDINGLSLSSSVDKTKHLRFVKNAHEFREKTIEEIQKNK